MRKRVLAPVFAVLLTATLGTAAPIGDPPECVVALRWAEAHRGELPTTLREYSRYPEVYRKAMYQVLSPAARQALWREQYEGYLRPGQPLNDAQRSAVREVITKLPALTAATPDRAEAERLRTRFAPLFDRELFKAVFYRLGPADAAPQTAQAQGRRPLCDCESDLDCESVGYGYVCKYSLCTFAAGCGFNGSTYCARVCGLP